MTLVVFAMTPDAAQSAAFRDGVLLATKSDATTVTVSGIGVVFHTGYAVWVQGNYLVALYGTSQAALAAFAAGVISANQ